MCWKLHYSFKKLKSILLGNNWHAHIFNICLKQLVWILKTVCAFNRRIMEMQMAWTAPCECGTVCYLSVRAIHFTLHLCLSESREQVSARACVCVSGSEMRWASVGARATGGGHVGLCCHFHWSVLWHTHTRPAICLLVSMSFRITSWPFSHTHISESQTL